MPLILFIIIFISFCFVLFLLFSLIIPFTKGAPYVVSSPDKRKTMMKFAAVKKGERAVDIGSGDGTLVILLAKAGAEAHGYEINPFLVWKSRRKIKQVKVRNAYIHWKSFWMQDVSKFDVITIYGIGFIMKDLEKKLQKECTNKTRVISNYFTFPTLPVIKMENDVYVYKIR